MRKTNLMTAASPPLCCPLWLAGADADRPLRLEVTVKLNRPAATGMPSESEATEFPNLGFRLDALLPRGARAEHAMTITERVR